MRALTLGLLALTLALTACDKKETPTPTTGETPTTPAATTTTTAAATATAQEEANAAVPEVEVDGIPTEEDFEDKAEEQVTASNMEAELDKLEKEISAN